MAEKPQPEGGLRRAPEPFGAGWQVHLPAFARQMEEGGVFRPLERVAAGFATSPPSSIHADSVSATLGWLYLEQGHVAEAETIFARVLAELPGDARALEGRRKVTLQRRNQRRVARLRRFLDRLQRPID